MHVARYNRVADPDAAETWSALRRSVDNSVQRWVLPAAFKVRTRMEIENVWSGLTWV